MSPSTRRETTSCSPWCRSAWLSRDEISSGCCIMEPFMAFLSSGRTHGVVRGERGRCGGLGVVGGARGVGFVGTGGKHEGGSGGQCKQRGGRQGCLQAPAVGQQSRNEGPGRKAEQVLEQRQHRGT